MHFVLFFLYFLTFVTPFQFYGEETWDNEYRELCDAENVESKNNLYCLDKLLLPSFETVKIEILNLAPALVKYHEILTDGQVERMIEMIRKETLELQTVDLEDTPVHPSRQANGSFIWQNDIPEIMKTLEPKLPHLNFTASESLQTLSYLPGGHYAPHYDYLQNQTDWWFVNMRNRLATLILVFQPAEDGGGTAFPELGITVKAKAGDAFFWYNMKADESQDDLSLHGGCPVYSGEKIIGTFWMRADYQPVLSKCLHGDESISISTLL